MQKDLLQDIISMLAGKNAVPIVEILYSKGHVNEFVIAKKLNMTINQTRNILYKLSDEGLVSFIRKKDLKKGGWYTYSWTLNTGKGLAKMKNYLVLEIDKKKSHFADRSNKRYYYSKGADLEYSEEEALENSFICPETGEVLELRNNEEIITHIKLEISKLEKAIAEVNLEITDVQGKENKVKEKRIKAEELKKKKEREKRKKELKRLRVKNKAGKSVKEKVRSESKKKKSIKIIRALKKMVKINRRR